MSNRTRSLVWGCLCGVFLGGCYSSEVIKPNGEREEKFSSGQVEWVTLKDGRRFNIPTDAVVLKDSIRWTTYQTVSIPLADVAHKYTVLPEGGGDLERMLIVVTRDSVRHSFETLPELSADKAMVGDEVIFHSSPLSDVAEASVKKLPVGWKIVYGVVGVAAAVTVIVFCIELAYHPINVPTK